MEALPLFTLIIKRCPLVPGLPVIITSEQSTSLDVVSTSIQHTKVIARPPLLRPYPIELRNMHDKRHQGSSQNFDFSRWTEQQQQQQKAAKMATEAQGRVQHAVEKMLDQVEKEKLRPLLATSHLCAAKCCEDLIYSKSQLEQCMQKCFIPAQQVQEYIGKELNSFQDRLSRCAKKCQDDVQDKIDSNTTHEHVSSLQAELDSCVVDCCNTHVDLVPKMMDKINQLFGQLRNANRNDTNSL